jgi:hypothetical protein
VPLGRPRWAAMEDCSESLEEKLAMSASDPVSGTFPGSQDPFQRSRALWDCAQTPLFPLVNARHTRLRLRCGITSILHARHPGLRRRSNFETRRQRVIKKRDAKLADPLTRQDDE